MQNAPAMSAQKMMSRQSPYGGFGMVGQDMSGNKKKVPSVPVGTIGLAFNTTSASAGVVFSANNTTVTNPTASIRSAKATAAAIPNVFGIWYWEFTVRSTTQQMYVGVGLPSFVCSGSNRVGVVTNSVAYNTGTGQVIANGGTQTTVASSTAAGDVIGFKLEVFNPGSQLTILKNNEVILNQLDTSTWLPDFGTAWTPIWSGITVANSSITISNNIYSYADCTPIGSSVTTISASASVPAVADGKYDVYTFNASGTFTAGSTGVVRALAIAGGGAGGQTYGAGGAGGYQEKGVSVTPQTFAVTVGAGGAGQPFTGTNQSLVSNNGNSTAFSTIASVGGGGGGSYSDTAATAARVGGSGGGGSLVLGGDVAGAAGTTGQGFAGGNANGSGPNYGGGGGGGASAVGVAGTTTKGGNGGAGKSSDITGTAVTRGGGGGGSFYGSGGTIGTGGAGGGGDGASTGANAAGIGVPGTANTGGGAGGAHSDGNASTSASGGSGVVIIRVRARA